VEAKNEEVLHYMEEFKYISFRFSDKGRLLKNLSGKIIPLFWVFDTYTSNQSSTDIYIF
jgi:hypothetical protein